MYKIGELSKLSKIPVKTLRYYDREGILFPDYIDPLSGYRYYNAIKLSDCYRIVSLKELGFHLSEIREILSGSQEQFRKVVETKRQELYVLKKQTEHRLNILANLDSVFQEDLSMFHIIIRKNDEIHLAYKRKIISDSSEYDPILNELHSQIPKEIIGSRMVIVDYETEFVEKNFDTGFGIEITGKLPDNCALSEKTLTFQGDTANLVCTRKEYEKAAKILNQYVLDNHYQIIGPIYQMIYPDNTIEIKLPVVKLDNFNPNYSEDINMPFMEDNDAIGRWKLFDCLPCKEMFHPQKPKSTAANEFVQELYFLPNGEKYWCFGWTKGFLLSDYGYPHRKCKNKYNIEKIGNEIYMFIEFKGESYFKGGCPELWVFRKIDSKEYQKHQIQITDEIPQIPAEDSSVLGKWQVCAWIKTIDAFDPYKNCSLIPYSELYWRSAEFKEGGAISNGFRNSEDNSVCTDAPDVWRWVTGYVICNPRSTACRYIIHKYNNTEYLFIQWKSGDYSFGRKEPSWYVFKR